ncbi:4-coumarate-CoA ligase-like protein [Kalaharituber pfeilii]|nr:4-coumarate-CoA ligase-like protein [Kalaharituber pfeilii]
MSALTNDYLPSYPDEHVIFIQAETDEFLSYATIHASAKRLGIALQQKLSWQEGDVLAIVAPSIIQIPIVVMGTFWANGVVTLANPLLTKEQLVAQLKDSGSKAIIVDAALLPLALEAAAELNIPSPNILVFSRLDSTPSSVQTIFEFSASVTDEEISSIPRPARKLPTTSLLASIPYTSGTTGQAKGVELTHANLLHDGFQFLHLEGTYTAGSGWSWDTDRLLSILPWFHQYGLFTMIIAGLCAGIPIYTCKRFDFVELLTNIQKYKITYATIIPPIFAALAMHPVVDKFDLSSLTQLYSAGSFLEHRVGEAVRLRLTKQGAKVTVRQGYGMTEACPVIASQTIDDIEETKGTCGYLLPGVEAKIIDPDTLAPTPEDTIGRLLLRGPNIFRGYHNLPEVNAACFDKEGWFITGDLATIKNGAITVVGREAEAVKIRSKGLIILPNEIEEVLQSHEKVKEGVIAAIDGTKNDQIAMAFVILQDGVEQASKLKQEIIDFVASKVSPEKRVIESVSFVDSIPKTPAGKILRRVLLLKHYDS